MSSRCPHCNIVLSDAELKSPQCAVCGKELPSIGQSPRGLLGAAEPTADTVTESPTENTEEESTVGGTTAESPSRLTNTRWLSVLILVFLLAFVYFVISPAMQGETSRLPSRLLGLALLSIPFFFILRAAPSTTKAN